MDEDAAVDVLHVLEACLPRHPDLLGAAQLMRFDKQTPFDVESMANKMSEAQVADVLAYHLGDMFQFDPEPGCWYGRVFGSLVFKAQLGAKKNPIDNVFRGA